MIIHLDGFDAIPLSLPIKVTFHLFFFTSMLMMGFSFLVYSSLNSLIFSNCSFLCLASFTVFVFCIFLFTYLCFFNNCFTTCSDILYPLSSNAFEIALWPKLVHLMASSIGLPAVS